MAKLLVQESAGTREFELVDNEVHIGRELDNALRLADPSISRHHAVIRRTQAGWEVQDLQSSNGVLVNGNRVPSSLLQDGDRVTLGQIQMTFSEPAASLGTVMMPAGEPQNPLGTVRMDASEMAKIQGVAAAPAPLPPPAPVPTAPVAAPVPPPAPVAPPPPAPAAVPPPPVAPPVAHAAPVPPPPAPLPPPPAVPPVQPPPSYGAVPPPNPSGNPAPGFLRGYLPPVPDDARPVMGMDGQPERGAFVPRLLAYLIDISPLLLLMVVSMVIQFATMGAGIGMRSAGMAATGGAVGCLLGLLQFVLGLGYLFFVPWCWIQFGATPGKKIMKLRVVPMDQPMGRLDLGGAILRLVGYLVNGIIGFIVGLVLMIPVGLILGMTGSLGVVMVLSPLVYLAALGSPYLIILGAQRRGLHDMIGKSMVIRVDR